MTWQWLLGLAAGAWVYDVVLRPASVAQRARAIADRLGKPVLNMGAGTPNSSYRVWLLGPTLWGDVNMDIASRESYCGPDVVCHGDVNSIPYPDKTFGAAIASHVLEHLDDPQRGLDELQRVADYVFIVVPKWWAPHTWLYWDHRWFIGDDGRMTPLWQ